MLARVVALNLLFIHAVPFVLAQSGETIVDSPEATTTAETDVNAESHNDVDVTQDGGDGAAQDAEVNADAQTDVEANQTVNGEHEVDIDQECETGTGNALCIEESAPSVVTEAVQHVDASSENDLNVHQSAGTGATQNATVSGSAVTNVTATQDVTSDVIIDIFQDCSMQKGVCIQRALPEVLTRATQVIAASALNKLESVQEAGTGSTQNFSGDLTAEVNVNAEQRVSPRAFLALTQLCAIDVGMCVQRAIPMVQAAVEQVIDAQAHNNADVLQAGAQEADATLSNNADTNVVSRQEVDSHTTVEMVQSCGVEKGLCLKVDETGKPTYVFTDGETTTTGDYTGNLDEMVLQAEYSRSTVGTVASGICGGASSCSMVDQLLFWLFGPEPTEQVPSVNNRESSGGDGGNYAHRGQQTNVLGASVRFLAQHMEEETIAPPAFGGAAADTNGELTPTQRALICSMRTSLLKGERNEGVWEWTALEIGRRTGLSRDTAMMWIRNESVCPQEEVAAVEKPDITFFPVSKDGPVSSNALWNACVRGDRITLEDIRNNPDRDEDGLPRTCGSYHTGDSWYHPDLGVYFTWNRITGELQLPDGYIPAASGIAAAANDQI